MQPVARVAVVVFGAALAAGCPKPAGPADPTDPADSAETEPAPPSASQREMAKRLPSGSTDYHQCVKTEEDGNTQRLFSVTTATTIVVNGSTISMLSGIDWIEYQLAETYEGDAFMVPDDQEDTESWGTKGNHRAIIVLDEMLYVVTNFGAHDYPRMRMVLICVLGDDERAIRLLSGDEHRGNLLGYLARREEVAAAAGWPHLNDDDDALTAEEEEQLARARTMVSFTLSVSANEPDRFSLGANAQLADGSTMVIRSTDAIFDDVFECNAMDGGTQQFVMVDCWSRDDSSIRAEQEAYYAYKGEVTFECGPGKTGMNGADTDSIGAMYRVGSPGGPGPDITVEITTTGARNDDGDQILRYRLFCAATDGFSEDQTKVFNLSASSEVHVASYGGGGGYAIAQANGDGTNGGPGGPAGDIEVIVDPSVEAYNLTNGSRGGGGGTASDPALTNDSTEGKPGRRGDNGSMTERRESVEIP